jgi:hypothetical protein
MEPKLVLPKPIPMNHQYFLNYGFKKKTAFNLHFIFFHYKFFGC